MGAKVLQAIASYLGLERHLFDERWPRQQRPAAPALSANPEGRHRVRAGAHGDINAITCCWARGRRLE